MVNNAKHKNPMNGTGEVKGGFGGVCRAPRIVKVLFFSFSDLLYYQ